MRLDSSGLTKFTWIYVLIKRVKLLKKQTLMASFVSRKVGCCCLYCLQYMPLTDRPLAAQVVNTHGALKDAMKVLPKNS